MKAINNCILRLFCLAVATIPSLQGRAGEGLRETTHTTLFGIGKVNHLDTYLSPLEYKGPQLTFLSETHRTLRRNSHVLFSTMLQGEFSYTESPKQNAHDMGGSVRYDAGWHRQWKNVLKGLDLSAGALAGGDIGFLYNNRNGNNPAQARANLRLSASLRGDYCFKIKKQTLALHYQAHLPLLGATFMPQYGQSYFNMFAYLNKYPNGSYVSDVNFYLGECLFNEKKYDEARASWLKAISAKAKNYTTSLCYYYAAVCSEELNDTENAISYYKSASEDEDFLLVDHALFSLGRVSESAEKYSDAKSAYEKLFELRSTSNWGQLAKSRLIALKADGKIE